MPSAMAMCADVHMVVHMAMYVASSKVMCMCVAV